MAAGRFGSASATISIEDSPGGTARVITGFVNSDYSIKIRAALEDITAFGDATEAYAGTGVSGADAITFEGFWDTTLLVGPHVVFLVPDAGPQDDGRQVILVFGDSKTCTFDVKLSEYEVMGVTKNLTKYKATVQPTGAVVWT